MELIDDKSIYPIAESPSETCSCEDCQSRFRPQKRDTYDGCHIITFVPQMAEPNLMTTISEQPNIPTDPTILSAPVQTKPQEYCWESAFTSRMVGGLRCQSTDDGPRLSAGTVPPVKYNDNGNLWLKFRYLQEKGRPELTIQCNVESVDLASLSPGFKVANIIYPNAAKLPGERKGNRQEYENSCNEVGWALAYLNTCLRGHRGRLQAAVSAWRNSHPDEEYHSRHKRQLDRKPLRSSKKAKVVKLDDAENILVADCLSNRCIQQDLCPNYEILKGLIHKLLPVDGSRRVR